MPSMTGCRKVPESSLNLSQPQLLFDFGVCAARSAGATRELRCLPQAWSRWKRRLRRRWSSALLSRSSWRMASLPSACAVALRVMPVSLAARSSSTPTVAGVLMVVVRSPARTLPRWTDPQPTFADRWQSLWWAAAWVHDALCSSLMPLVLPSHCLITDLLSVSGAAHQLSPGEVCGLGSVSLSIHFLHWDSVFARTCWKKALSLEHVLANTQNVRVRNE